VALFSIASGGKSIDLVRFVFWFYRRGLKALCSVAFCISIGSGASAPVR
jgi:hypothetical protein